MYWPIGAPRVYAACNNKASRDRQHQFDDDAESSHATEDASYINAPSANLEVPQDEEGMLSAGHLTPSTPRTPAIQPVEHHAQPENSTRSSSSLMASNAAVKEAQKQPILGLRMSRQGHLFAVITATSMTIWQTKVLSSQDIYVCFMLIHDCSQPLYWHK